MSIATVIIGKSGTGKTTSLRNIDPTQALLIQAVPKPLPFKSKGWTVRDPATKQPFNILRTDSAKIICDALAKTTKKIVVIDDFQYVLANELMRRSEERGYDKFSDIARHGWDVFQAASAMPDDVRVYILSHSDEDEAGRIKLKTVGKMLDEKIVLEGLVTIVLRTEIFDDKYYFRTRNNGSDTTKTPMGMFDAERIENDLAEIDSTICAYFDITKAPTKTQTKAA